MLRLAHGEANLRTQVRLQRTLHAAGLPTMPVLEAGTLPGNLAYSLEPFVEGDAGPPTPAGWADLGRTLAALHALPCRGHGLLLDQGGPLTGRAPDPVSGLLTRLTHIAHRPGSGGLDPADLGGHALVLAAPELLAPLRAGWDDLLRTLAGPHAPGHTDLHAGNLCWRGGRLAALFDFGDAAAGPAVWDVASVAYFHGWAAAKAVADAARITDLPGAARFGLLLALHRAGRAGGRGQSPARAVAFARACLDRLKA